MISVLEISFRTVIWFVIKPSRVRNKTRLTVNQVISVTGWYFSPLLGSIREFGLSFFCLIQQQPKHKKASKNHSRELSVATEYCGISSVRCTSWTEHGEDLISRLWIDILIWTNMTWKWFIVARDGTSLAFDVGSHLLWDALSDTSLEDLSVPQLYRMRSGDYV